jgi:hypothetical protein
MVGQMGIYQDLPPKRVSTRFISSRVGHFGRMLDLSELEHHIPGVTVMFGSRGTYAANINIDMN